MNTTQYFLSFRELSQSISNLVQNYTKTFVIVDSNTLIHCWPKIAFEGSDAIEILEVEPGEESKSLEIAYQLWSALREAGADRKSLVLNLGGGVITDLGGFVASTFKRGIDYIQIPTSLLAMVDAAIGGKTGINLDHSKNQIGTFKVEAPVFICSKFLDTLDDRQMNSGYAEVIKHGLISNHECWNVVKCYDLVDKTELDNVVREAVKIKSKVVEEDPYEKGIRKSLNFGHTVGHALESASMDGDAPLLHGEAVALGMYVESKIALEKKHLIPTEFEEIHIVLEHFFDLNRLKEFSPKLLWEEMQNDKKNENGEVIFILLKGIGNPDVQSKLHYETFESAFISCTK